MLGQDKSHINSIYIHISFIMMSFFFFFFCSRGVQEANRDMSWHLVDQVINVLTEKYLAISILKKFVVVLRIHGCVIRQI